MKGKKIITIIMAFVLMATIGILPGNTMKALAVGNSIEITNVERGIFYGNDSLRVEISFSTDPKSQLSIFFEREDGTSIYQYSPWAIADPGESRTAGIVSFIEKFAEVMPDGVMYVYETMTDFNSGEELARTSRCKVTFKNGLVDSWELCGLNSGEEGEGHHSKKHRSDSSTNYNYTETENGIVYGGMVDGKFSATTMIPASAYPKFNQFVGKKITEAKSGDTVKINCEPWTSLPGEILENLAAKSDISLELHYTLDNVRYKMTIPAGTDVKSLIDENGYCGLARLGEILKAVPEE